MALRSCQWRALRNVASRQRKSASHWLCCTASASSSSSSASLCNVTDTRQKKAQVAAAARVLQSRAVVHRTEQVERQLLRVSHVASLLHASNAKHCSVSTLPAIHQHHHVVQFPALLVLCLWCGCCEWLPTVFSTACLSWSSTKSSSEYMHTTLCALLVVAAVVVLCCCPCSSISLIEMPSSWKHQQHSARASAPR